MSVINSRMLVAGSAVMIGGQAVQVAVAFAANLILVQYLSPAEFGRFALVLASASLILSVVSIRINTLVFRASDDALDESTKQRYFTVIAIETVLAAAIGLVWTALAGISEGWATALVIAVCARHWLDQNKSFFERRMPYVRLGLFETGVSILMHVASVVMVLSGVGAATLYWREIIGVALSFVGLGLLGGVSLFRFRLPDTADWRRILGEIRGVWIDSALDGAYQRVVIQCAGLIGGDRAAGYFFQAQRLAFLPQQLLAPFAIRIVSNWFGRLEHPAPRIEARGKVLGVLALPLFGAALGAYFFADPIVPMIFGQAWAPAAGILAALSGFILFSCLFEVLRAYCAITRHLRILLLGRIAQYLATITVVAWAIAGGGLDAVKLAFGVSAGFAAAFLFVLIALTRKELNERTREAA